MNTTNLPALTAIHAQPGRAASLSISTGRLVTVATADHALFTPDLGVLIVHGEGYTVPPALFADLRAALTLEGAAQEGDRADLPTLAGITALALGRAVLHLVDGSSVEMDAKQRDVYALGEAPCYLTIGHGESWQIYAVPDALYATVCAALRLYRKREGPPRLTLTGIDEQETTVTFGASNGEGQAVSLTMPRPLGVQPSFPTEREPGVPVDLYVTREDTPPSQGFSFKVYPEAPEGRAVLELLGLAAQVTACSEGHRLN